MNNENAVLFLQKIQNEHDCIAHQEVVYLEKDKRLNHYVLHFFKYASNICDLNDTLTEKSINNQEFKKQLRDTFLLTLAIANTYDVELIPKIINSDFRNILKVVYSENIINKSEILDFTYKSILKNGSKMAKRIESIDHLEPISIEKEILSHNRLLFSDILIPMAILQEEYGIYWEKEIVLTHALIKMKKPWVRAKCQNEFSKNDYTSTIPLFDFDNDIENLVTHINSFIDNKNKESSYKSDIKFELDAEILNLNNSVTNRDLYNFQFLQNKKENAYVGVSELKENNIKRHLEKNLFKLANRFRDIYVLKNSNKDLSLVKDEILVKLLESFEITLSISSKLNQNIDFFFKDMKDIEKKSAKEIFSTIYSSKKQNEINMDFDNCLLMSSDLSQILIDLNILKDKNNPISKEVITSLNKISNLLCSLFGFMEENYNLDITTELMQHLEKDKPILSASKLKF